MSTALTDIFNEIPSPSIGSSDKPLYAMLAVPGHPNYFVGKDKQSLACLIISTSEQPDRSHPPIRFENLDAQFGLRCHLKSANKPQQEGDFAVIRCRDNDRETIRYFLSVCETLLRVLGDQPTHALIVSAVNRLAAIFRKVRQPPTRSLNGLFGELYLILRSANTAKLLKAWRANQNARFDFSADVVRLDVKTAGGRNRVHTFSYDQCNPPSGTIAVVASLHVEQSSGGPSLYSIINQIETRVSADVDLALKLHETVAATLGTSFKDALSRHFDMRLADSSLRFFNLKDVPAIRGPLPVGVSDVHFRSDLSALPPVSIEELVSLDPIFRDILPSK